jgi:hypothetical protein
MPAAPAVPGFLQFWSNNAKLCIIALIESPWLCKAKRDGSPFKERYDQNYFA